MKHLSRNIKYIFYGLILLLLIWALLPLITITPSLEAIVDADTYDITAVTGGHLDEVAAENMSYAERGTVIAVKSNQRFDGSRFTGLTRERNDLTNMLISLAAKEQHDAEFQTELEARYEQLIAASEELFRAQIEELEAKHDALYSELQVSGSELKRYEVLEATQLVDAATTEAITAKNARLKHECKAMKAAIKGLKIRRNAVEKGFFLNEGYNDVPYTQQEIDRVKFRRAELKAELEHVQERITELDTHIATEGSFNTQQETVTYKTPVNSMITRIFVKEDQEITPGTKIVELIDVDTIHLDVLLDEDYYDVLNIGSKVRVRLNGSTQEFSAEVYAKIGNMISLTKQESMVQAGHKNSVLLKLKFNYEELGASPANAFYYGRKASVIYDNLNLLSFFTKYF